MTRDTAERAKELSPEQRKYAHELAEAVALKWLSRPLDEQDIHAGLMWVLAAIEKFGMRVQAEATLAEHESHVQFESELYAILVDPVAEGSIKETEMRKALTEAALRSRELANKFNFTDLLKAAQEGLEIWAAKPGNHKWWKRIDGTPIPNDLLVDIVQRIAALAQALQPEEKEGT